jgi:hypothetical protein
MNKNLKTIEAQLIKLRFHKTPLLTLRNISTAKALFISIDPPGQTDRRYHRYILNRKGIAQTLRYAQLLNSKQEEKMKVINESIRRLTKIIHDKGYQRPFHMEGWGTEMLPDLLKNYCEAAIRDPMKEAFPFVASMYSKITKDDSGYVKCSYSFDFKDKQGIELTHIDVINCQMDHKVIEHWERPIKNAADIPHKQQANNKVMAVDNKKKKYKGFKR